MSLDIVEGMITGAGNSAPLGDFVADAATLDAPAEPTLKDPASFRLIGNADVRRLDSAIKGNGKAMYAMDLHLPDQMIAMIARPEQRGALATRFDDRTSARARLSDFLRSAQPLIDARIESLRP